MSDFGSVSDAITAAAAAAALGVSIVALRRSPNVVWVKERDEIVKKSSATPANSSSQYTWEVEFKNRGREKATDVRTRFFDPNKAAESEQHHGEVLPEQGLTITRPINAHSALVLQLPDLWQGGKHGPHLRMTWRGPSGRQRSKVVRPTPKETTV